MIRAAFVTMVLVCAAGCDGDALNPVDLAGADLAGADLAGGALLDLSANPPADLVPGPDLSSHSLVEKRPYMSKAPAGYDAARAWPLVVLLHGYSATGATQDLYFGFSKIVDSKGFLYAYPDGLIDNIGKHFWNASDACCNLFKSPVDDVAYLTAVIDDMRSRYHVDERRIFLVGHSNGAFMSHRMACDRADRVAAIVALAGDVWDDASKCNPSTPVSVLQIHGDADAVINYNGGKVAAADGPYPSARACIDTWAAKNGCMAGTVKGAPLDLDRVLIGDETLTELHEGCKGGAAALWTIKGGSHAPNLQPTWAATLYDWLAAHPKR